MLNKMNNQYSDEIPVITNYENNFSTTDPRNKNSMADDEDQGKEMLDDPYPDDLNENKDENEDDPFNENDEGDFKEDDDAINSDDEEEEDEEEDDEPDDDDDDLNEEDDDEEDEENMDLDEPSKE